MKTLRIALAQINSTVGDLKGNAAKIIRCISQASCLDADVVVFPELSLCGYPPEDLLLKPSFIKESRKYLNKVAGASGGVFSIVGFPYFSKGALFNAAALINRGKLLGVYKKIKLPNYGVFDEMRYFKPGAACPVITLGDNLRIGVNICEDIWHKHGPQRAQSLAGGAKIIINISASPYCARKIRVRENMLRSRARENGAFILYCNLVGGQDELVFDGASMAIDPRGNLIARAKQFEEDLLTVDLETASIKRPQKDKMPLENRIEKLSGTLKEIYSALVLGLRDYVNKNNFRKIVFGLSGGIDSAFTAVLAVDALGRDNVVALSMPSEFSSAGARRDARAVAKNLGIKHLVIPISGIYKAYLNTLRAPFGNTCAGVAEENIQARIRGNLLMALSNKFGWLVVTTGNKSELSVGYCTLYGDTAGGFAAIKDVPKTLVYRLARHRNAKAGAGLIPESIFARAPSAELRRGQKDRDVLPPYPKLDRIIDAYIEKDLPLPRIAATAAGKKSARRIISMIDRNEYKRRQSPVGIKITPKAFGKDRRMPITNKFYQ